jgi:hypothetical protein
VFVLAQVLDVVYQIIATRFVYPGEALVTAVLLAIVPYLVMRGLVTRIARTRREALLWIHHRHVSEPRKERPG